MIRTLVDGCDRVRGWRCMRSRRRAAGQAAVAADAAGPGGAARRDGLQADLRRPEPEGLGLRSRFLAAWRTERSWARPRPITSRTQNIFCIWRGGKPADFELKLQYRLTGADTGNSGIQYRSVELPDVAKWVLKGYQADIDAQQQLYRPDLRGARPRRSWRMRGQFTYIGDGKKPGAVGSLGDGEELKSFIKDDDWNEIHIIARGNTHHPDDQRPCDEQADRRR